MSFGSAENMLQALTISRPARFRYSRISWHAPDAQLHYLRRLITISAVKQILRWMLL